MLFLSRLWSRERIVSPKEPGERHGSAGSGSRRHGPNGHRQTERCAGGDEIAIACGVESMTRAPMASNSKGGTGPFSQDFLAAVNGKLGIQFWVAQVLAEKFGITREEMDAYALESHRRAAENTDNGHFAREIIPVPIKDPETGELTGETLARDEGIRANTSLEALAQLPPAMSWAPDEAPDITA